MSVRRRAEEVFETALDVRPEEREPVMAAAADGDAEVLAAAQSLLAAHERAGGILEVDARSLLGPEQPVPERLGVYRVLREIGRGGMGVVYEAERDDGQFRRRVAIKVLRAGDDRGLRQRVLAERQILAGLDHPHIARLLDGGVAADGRPYLVMERVDGLPIDVYCDRMRLDVRERLRLFIDVARAVAFAHHNLVVHRDLKPSNILVSGSGVVKLLDFGVATMLNPALGGALSPTLPDRLALTPEYASPEQLRGETLTTQSDVFALGALLYELLTGRRAFAGAGLAALIRAVCDEDVVPPSSVVLRDVVQPALDGSTRAVDALAAAHARQVTPQRLVRELRGDLDAIVVRALRREPRHRYESAEQFADDMERQLTGLPIMAQRRGPAYAFVKFASRHRGSSAAVLLGALSLLAGTAAAVRQAHVARAERDRAHAARAASDEVTEYMIGLFEAGAPGAVATEALTARELVRRGAFRIDDLSGQPLVYARILGALGRVHGGLGDYTEGERLTRRALSIQAAQPASEPDDVARLLLQLGILQRQQSAYDSAQVSFMRGHAMLAGPGRPPPATLAGLFFELAGIAVYLGDLAEAEQRAREAQLVLERELGPTHRFTVNALGHLGAVQYQRGLPEAEQTLRRVLQLRPLAAGSTRAEVAADRLRLAGLLLSERRSLVEAEQLSRLALAAMRTDDSDEFVHATWARSNLALLHELRGELEAAERYHREVIELHRTVYGSDHDLTGQRLAVFGRVLTRWGRPDEAEQYFNDAAAIQQETFGARHPSYAVVLSDRALLLAARGDRAGAEALLTEALDTALAHGGEHSILTRSIHSRFADLYTSWGRHADAARHRAASEDERI